MNGIMKVKKTIYLGLGSNLGNKVENLKKAIYALSNKLGVYSSISSLYESEPWGFQSKHTFLNIVVEYKTDISPFDLLNNCQQIEKNLGRLAKKGNSYESRKIDIDILLYEDLILKTTKLTIPHRHISKRRFVLEPLFEICDKKEILAKYQSALIKCRNNEELKKNKNHKLF